MNSLDATTPQLKGAPKTAKLPDQTKDEHLEVFGPIFLRLAKLEHIFHEAIEAPGKVVLQLTALCTPPDGETFEYDTLTIFHLVEEDGELKVLEFKDFADTEKRSNFYKTLSGEGQIA